MKTGTGARRGRGDALGGTAYRRLKEMIHTARLRPGVTLVERDLAAQLGVSRTPVREALTRLAAEGLVAPRPRRGYVVAEMDPEQVAGLYAVREVLEALAVRLAVARMGPAAHRELERTVAVLVRTARSGGDGRPAARPGLPVHDCILRHSGNAFLYDTWRRLAEKLLPYVWIETLDADDAAQTLREHRALCRLIRAGRARAAEDLLRSHIGRARDNLIRVLTLQGGGAGDRKPTRRRGGRGGGR